MHPLELLSDAFGSGFLCIPYIIFDINILINCTVACPIPVCTQSNANLPKVGDLFGSTTPTTSYTHLIFFLERQNEHVYTPRYLLCRNNAMEKGMRPLYKVVVVHKVVVMDCRCSVFF
jgi:hypothetical protein